MTGSVEQELREFFTHYTRAKLVFLVGSFARGSANRESDVDVAVLFGYEASLELVDEMRESLALLLSRDVDIVVLDTAGPIMGMQALKTGVLLYAGPNDYEMFFTRTLNEYHDLKFFRKEIEESVTGRRLYA